MARIAGVDIPRDKRVEIALTYIYGIGNTTSQTILEATQIDPNVRVKDLDENTITSCSKSAGRVRRGHGCAPCRRHRRLPQRSRLV